MIRVSLVRNAILFCTASFVLSVSGCSSGGDNVGSTNAPSTPTTNAAAKTGGPATDQSTGAAAKLKLNVNTASANDFLTTIPGMGNKMVHEFEEYRPYRSIQQFRKEIGKYVSPAQVAEYEKYIFVPITPNEADAPTLQQIPGLDATEAQSLIAARPFASSDAFISKLAGSVSEAELAIAKTYLAGK